MTRAVEQIDRDIAALEEMVRAIAQEFHNTYNEYLAVLGKAMRQQLILAAYYLCTQGYPERFLQLSLNQQQALQQELQRLARKTQAQMQQFLIPVPIAKETSPEAIAKSETQDTASEELSVISTEHLSLGEEQIWEETNSDFYTELTPRELPFKPIYPSPERDASQAEIEEEDASQSEDLAEDLAKISLKMGLEEIQTPKDLMRWQDNLEQMIVETLQLVSHAANRMLQRAGMLPEQLPEPVLEVAAKAGIAADATVGPPNLLNLIVETEDKDEETSSITHVMAIRLRLSEIEFSDPTLTNWRSKVRQLMGQLGKLKQEYQKKKRERAIAAAEAAWRSSWYEES